MQEALRAYRDDLLASGKSSLETRIGVNTGEVVVRTVEAGGHSEYTPIGLTANIAARLQTLAKPGSIAISEDTQKLVQHYFELRALGPMPVKGVTHLVNIYEVIGPGRLRTHFQVSARLGLTVFVGRGREMDELRRALQLAHAGHGQIVAVVGEPGVGKSRLFYEFKREAAGESLVLEAYSVSHGKASAYQPVLELLQVYFGISSADVPDQRRAKITNRIGDMDRAAEDILPYLCDLLGAQSNSDSLTHGDSQVKRRRTLESIKRIFSRESTHQPLVLIFEDLHWIDAETQALLDLIAGSIASTRLLLLVNYRPEYRHEWSGKAYYTQLRLDPLGSDSAAHLLQALLGDEVELVALKRLIISRAGGVPFFIEEMVQALFDEGVLVRDGTRLRVTRSSSQMHSPTTVQGILAARIDRLPNEEKTLLQTLSVLGRTFSSNLVQRVVDVPEDELNRLLHELELREFVHEQPGPSNSEIIFKHALTQEVAYQSVLVERRRRLHERAGEALEMLFSGRLEDHLAELAHHYSHSSNSSKALTYLQIAGEQAARRSANREAADYLKLALHLLKTSPETRERLKHELDLLIDLGPVVLTLEGYASVQGEEVYKRARELCHLTGDNSKLFPVLWGLWLARATRAEFEVARGLGQELLAVAEETKDQGIILEAHHALWASCVYLGELASAQTHLNVGRALYNREQHHSHAVLYGGHDPGVCCLIHSALNLCLLGAAEEAVADEAQALLLATAVNHPNSMAWVYIIGTLIHQLQKDKDGAIERARVAIEISAEHDFAQWLSAGRLLLCSLQVQAGLPTENVAKIETILNQRRTVGAKHFEDYFLALLARNVAANGDPSRGITLLKEAISVSEAGERWCLAECYRLMGECMVMIGGPEAHEAENNYRLAITIAQRQRAKLFEIRATSSLARLLRDTGRIVHARTLLSDICNNPVGVGTVDLTEAQTLLKELGE
jgi:predicted ATPase